MYAIDIAGVFMIRLLDDDEPLAFTFVPCSILFFFNIFIVIIIMIFFFSLSVLSGSIVSAIACWCDSMCALQIAYRLSFCSSFEDLQRRIRAILFVTAK